MLEYLGCFFAKPFGLKNTIFFLNQSQTLKED